MSVYEFQKSEEEKIIADVSEFKGRHLIDIRTFYQADGEWRPTKKGINIPLEKLSELETTLEKIKEAAANIT